MEDITIVNKVYKPNYNLGGRTVTISKFNGLSEVYHVPRCICEFGVSQSFLEKSHKRLYKHKRILW